MAPDPVLDLAVLNTLLEGDQPMIRRFAVRFLDSARGAMAEIDGALAAGDAAQLRHLGHRTRSAALTVGATAMAALCQRLEQLPPDGDAAAGAARSLVDQLHSALAATAARMQEAGLA